ncbi:MAG: hypothetical protein ACUVWP_07080 [bacterium]
MVEEVKVVFPLTHPGYAFEIFSIVSLKRHFGFDIIKPQFNVRLPSDKWVQLDGLLEKDGKRFVLEARFIKGIIGSTNIDLRLKQAIACGYDGLVITSRSNFKEFDLSEDCVFISLSDMLNNILEKSVLNSDFQILNACLDGVLFDKNYIRSEDAYIDTTSIGKYWRSPLYESDDIILLPSQYEIWVRRIGALTGRFKIEDLSVPAIKSINSSFEKGIDYLWLLEDLMSGMANLNISAMIETGRILTKGYMSFSDVIVGLRGAGYRAGISGTRDILKMLLKLGITGVKEKRYYLTDDGRRIFKGGLYIDLLKRRIADWTPVQFMSNIVDNIGYDVYNVMIEMERIYNGLFPYARNTFNKNRTQMLIDLVKFSE